MKNSEAIIVDNGVITVSLRTYESNATMINTVMRNNGIKDIDIKKYTIYKYVIKFYLYSSYKNIDNETIKKYFIELLEKFKRCSDA